MQDDYFIVKHNLNKPWSYNASLYVNPRHMFHPYVLVGLGFHQLWLCYKLKHVLCTGTCKWNNYAITYRLSLVTGWSPKTPHFVIMSLELRKHRFQVWYLFARKWPIFSAITTNVLAILNLKAKYITSIMVPLVHNYLSLFLSDVLYFGPALLPRLFIPYIIHFMSYSLKDITILMHLVQFALYAFFSPNAY